MNLKNLHSVHFLGIGGIGMSALARYFNHMGMQVSGYDKTPSPLTKKLEEEGMNISYVDDLEHVPSAVSSQKDNALIVWTPAMPKDSVQLNFFKSEGFELHKRAAVLGMITSSMPAIAVAGTHGKTTTSSMVAHLLKQGNVNVAAFLGGITQNYQSNLLLQDDQERDSWVVVEADEFDRSFLHLHPNVAVLTSVDPDHLDIYGNGEVMLEGFHAFLKLISSDGKLYIHTKAFQKLGDFDLQKVNVTPYGIGAGEVQAIQVEALPGLFKFDFVSGEKQIEGLELHMPGFHNVENALPAIAIAMDLGLSEDQIRNGIASFKGVKRRFEIHYQEEGKVYIDDYAHHPEEIAAFLNSVKAMYPKRKLTAVFQPHLFTRTRDFAKGFSESLSLADDVVLLDIYPARELPIEGVTSEMLLEGIKSRRKSLQPKAEVINYLKANSPEVLVTIGAGDIDRLVEPIAKWIQNED
ncbi:UDP-N-acetylmuramate--L-alanine ligase [Belliella kenyensis]|uniref:UDP-N-acetylmuramate--L-alanine ligase n=1 Tax=Belliella kenyensis TaxID=1472724 RepID=A0ABV8ERX9_9BACT|nr:UDP-N-acetylmuramate--L-alanine ligase [Belliella kenyensis]MCH7403836.1 UDP-N-acetylmuramate--L-alanine ligase [Belliella kenyensis]MDN3602452.1 UDP-N-acetylmuramate--L-alanine ligase [Belliella kenyensis]